MVRLKIRTFAHSEDVEVISLDQAHGPGLMVLRNRKDGSIDVPMETRHKLLPFKLSTIRTILNLLDHANLLVKGREVSWFRGRLDTLRIIDWEYPSGMRVNIPTYSMAIDRLKMVNLEGWFELHTL